MTHSKVDDARAVREAGARFASDLAGAAWTGFMLALAEQGERLRRAVLEAATARIRHGSRRLISRRRHTTNGCGTTRPVPPPREGRSERGTHLAVLLAPVLDATPWC